MNLDTDKQWVTLMHKKQFSSFDQNLGGYITDTCSKAVNQAKYYYSHILQKTRNICLIFLSYKPVIHICTSKNIHNLTIDILIHFVLTTYQFTELINKKIKRISCQGLWTISVICEQKKKHKTTNYFYWSMKNPIFYLLPHGHCVKHGDFRHPTGNFLIL